MGADPAKPRPKVGSAALVFNEDACILLGRRGKEPNFGRWVMPGGKIEHMESIEDAARREVKEETGLDVEITDRLGIFEIITPPEHSVFVLSKARVIGGELRPGDDLAEVAWFGLGEVPDLSDPCREALVALGVLRPVGDEVK